MLGFHIDMNVAQFKKNYLEKWIRELADLGYDTVLWEVEDNIKWQTCPECVSPEAFTKDEFKELLDLCRSLGMESIPVLQTLGHCEYVLKHDKYQYLAEIPRKTEQYCPLCPQLPPFLKKWIDEYLELFGSIKRFHIGADEALDLGKCPRCSDFAKRYSLSELYIQHISTISQYLIQRNVQPIIWADMILKHPEQIHRLSPKIMFADWGYNTYRDNGRVWVWSREQLCMAEQLDNETLRIYGDFLFPEGDEPGREPETFYAADFLRSHGFETITCPASSSYLDNVFAPRIYLHMKNVYDTIKKGVEAGFCGSILTSWTVHLFPWELQKECIELAPYIVKNPAASIEDYQKWFLQKHFGIADKSFFKAYGLLSKSCLFTWKNTLGFHKDVKLVPADHAEKTIEKLFEDGRLQSELENSLERLKEYHKGLELLNRVSSIAQRDREHISVWQLAARNLINRAMTSICLLKAALARNSAVAVAIDRQQVKTVLDELAELKNETKKLYDPIIKPMRLNNMLHWMYDSVENALRKEYNKMNLEKPVLKNG